ncbi:MAG: DEAD/SNF2-like helicase [Faunusvirus sp.]|jgi:hypothetical protein|uniref:DEAD/SNF2-like helicase n=1 Tax=Faunusvirus sp. TaxID=2487766 RepID=A0A3G4ZXB9_9VIRU|nr:MAG: DEAD/SNF2-like helicase [Faunusvirus sp.]
MYKQTDSSYVDLKVNGRLFPSWIMTNFKKYTLPEIMQKEGEDPCKMTQTKQELHKYQQFLAAYLDYRSPYKDILIYHGLGSGKTASAINIYNMLYMYTPAWNVYILIKASLEDDPWLKDIKSWLKKDDYAERFANIVFIHYDSPFADRDFIKAKQLSDSSKKNMYIIDECHLFINNVYNNIASKVGRRAHTIYDYILQEKKEDDSTRVLLLSGTPAVNNPFELVLIFNLLRPGIFPSSENVFNEMYIAADGYGMNETRRNMFQRRILGLVSYYIGATSDLFASQKTSYKTLKMDKYHDDVYEHFDYIEEQMDKASRKFRSKGKQKFGTYRSYTRQACDFVFPHIDDKVNGENRPRPSKFRISDREEIMIEEGKTRVLKEKTDDKTKLINISDYLAAINAFIASISYYFDGKKADDTQSGNTLEKDIEAFKTIYKFKFSTFWEQHKTKSSLLSAMYSCSCKMVAMIFYSLRSAGPLIMFSNYVHMEGLDVLKIYLKYFGFRDFNDRLSVDYYRYTEYHGDIDRPTRKHNQHAFNEPDNVDGKSIKIILLGPASTEGLSLMSVRQIHILDPYWTEVRIKQLIGRGIRMCSHKFLPIKERHVDIFRYSAQRLKISKATADEFIMTLARNKQHLIDTFLQTLKEVAVDCELFAAHNKINDNYKCFKFNETSLFDKQIAPAFNDLELQDLKLDNGLNSTKSVVKRIKVIKIKAVKKISAVDNADEDTETQITNKTEQIDAPDIYSDELFYWFDKDTGNVYEYTLGYLIGRVHIDVNKIPHKLDKDTYIIDRLIPIPMIKHRT